MLYRFVIPVRIVFASRFPPMPFGSWIGRFSIPAEPVRGFEAELCYISFILHLAFVLAPCLLAPGLQEAKTKEKASQSVGPGGEVAGTQGARLKQPAKICSSAFGNSWRVWCTSIMSI